MSKSQTDKQTYQKYSSEPHKITIYDNFVVVVVIVIIP